MEKARVLTQQALTDVRSSVSALRADPAESLPLEEMIAETIKTAKLLAWMLFQDIWVYRAPSLRRHT